MRHTSNYYDVTQWPVGNPYEDVGEVMNSILHDLSKRQHKPDENDGGKPGAVIYLPPGDYHLKTQVVIDRSFVKILGSGHGFISSSIRYNLPSRQWPDLHEVWPGGSRILVDLKPVPGDEASGAAFYIKREGDPRISSVEFENFCIDGLHYVEDGSADNPENTYENGKTGIYVASAQDSFRLNGMGMVYLEHGVVVYHADALSIHDNFIAECGNCIELRGWGQASKVTENLLGAGYKGYTIFAENFGGLLISANNVFPRGKSSVRLSRVARSAVTSNRFHAFYPGMLEMDQDCAENLISSNHFYRSFEPWLPMQCHDNGQDDQYGLVHIRGNRNSIIANHFSLVLDPERIRPQGSRPVIVRVSSGQGNFIAANHMIGVTEAVEQSAGDEDSCYSAQVQAMLSIGNAKSIDVITVQLESKAMNNTVLDSGCEDEVALDRTKNAFRPTPSVNVASAEGAR